jgi:hypothetical protein
VFLELAMPIGILLVLLELAMPIGILLIGTRYPDDISLELYGIERQLLFCWNYQRVLYIVEEPRSWHL